MGSVLLMAVVLSVAWSQAVLPRTFRFRDDFFSGPDSVWRRNVSGLAPTAHSFQQVEAAYTVLKGASVGVPNPTPLLPGPPGVLVQLRALDSPPIFDTVPNLFFSVPNTDYSGQVTGEGSLLPQPFLPTVLPSPPLGIAVLVNDTHETDLSQVTTFSVQGFSQGGGYIGPIEAVAASAQFRRNDSGAGIVSEVTLSGVPLLGGLFLPEDIERGFINHALAVTWPQFRNQKQYQFDTTDIDKSDFFSPCVTGIFPGSSWRQFALGCGQILRLKQFGKLVFENNSAIDENIFAPITQLVLAGMRTYGIIPVRQGISMTLLTESTDTGFLNISFSRAQELAGNNYTLVERKDGYWYQLLRVLAEDLSFIPLASSSIVNRNQFIIPDANLNLIKVEQVNWEIVSGNIGVLSIGESFISGYNYYGSIDVVLLILVIFCAVPLTVFLVFLLTEPL